jgi:thiamine-phosphate pyrophosphorylase
LPSNPGPSALYTFVDTAYLHGRNPVDVARQLCEGGSDLIQLRAKNSSPEELRRMAAAILPVTRTARIPLVINDDLEVAQELGVEFCHLGQEDFGASGFQDIASLKAKYNRLQIGLSTHRPAEAEQAMAVGADYIAIGPVYATATKPGARPVTLEYVRWAAANVSIPWFAIGGIKLENLEAVLAAGARRICVVSAILNAASIVEACQEFKRRLRSAA